MALSQLKQSLPACLKRHNQFAIHVPPDPEAVQIQSSRSSLLNTGFFTPDIFLFLDLWNPSQFHSGWEQAVTSDPTLDHSDSFDFPLSLCSDSYSINL